MPAKIIDGNKIAKSILENVKNKIKNMKDKPGLALVMVGSNPASEVYVNFKEKIQRKPGFIAKGIIWTKKQARWTC